MPSPQKVVSITLYPVYPDGYSNAVRELLKAKLKQAWADKLESDWYAMDCSSLPSALIFQACNAVVEATNFSGGGGPASVTAYDPGGGWDKVGDLHETTREIRDNADSETWEVEVHYQGMDYAAEVHAVYRTSAVKTFP